MGNMGAARCEERVWCMFFSALYSTNCNDRHPQKLLSSSNFWLCIWRYMDHSHSSLLKNSDAVVGCVIIVKCFIIQYRYCPNRLYSKIKYSRMIPPYRWRTAVWRVSPFPRRGGSQRCGSCWIYFKKSYSYVTRIAYYRNLSGTQLRAYWWTRIKDS